MAEICKNAAKHTHNRQVYCLVNIAKAYDSVKRPVLWEMVEKRVQRHKEDATRNGTLNEEDYKEIEATITALKVMYQDHTIVVGKQKIITTNGLI